MARGRRSLLARLRRGGSMERSVRRIVLGGVALVAGLWVAALSAPGSLPWLLGAVLALVGVGGLAAGIWSEMDIGGS